ncbi:MAG: hypothetical protein ABFS22_04695 [Pseudomonadota bacterium]
MTTLAMNPCECRIRTWSLLLLLWVVSAIVLAAIGVLATNDFLMPAFIVIPVAGFALTYRTNPSFRSYMLSLDTGVLVILHSWRMLGLGFLFLYAHNVLPGLFAWLAGAGDALAAIGATLIGINLLRGREVSKQALRIWNSFGLLDFLIAVTVGTALRSAWLGKGITTDVMGSLPLSLIPTLIVPFYIITHLVIFLQLRNGRLE